jgi:hypothetical protein
MDPVIAQAGTAVGLPASYLHSLFPSELTMWIDPAEVSYRIGENGSICVLYEESNSGQVSEDTGLERVTKADGSSGSSGSNANTSSSTSGCKESMRTMEFFLDPRGVPPFEQLAAYVSS